MTPYAALGRRLAAYELEGLFWFKPQAHGHDGLTNFHTCFALPKDSQNSRCKIGPPIQKTADKYYNSLWESRITDTEEQCSLITYTNQRISKVQLVMLSAGMVSRLPLRSHSKTTEQKIKNATSNESCSNLQGTSSITKRYTYTLAQRFSVRAGPSKPLTSLKIDLNLRVVQKQLKMLQFPHSESL